MAYSIRNFLAFNICVHNKEEAQKKLDAFDSLTNYTLRLRQNVLCKSRGMCFCFISRFLHCHLVQIENDAKKFNVPHLKHKVTQLQYRNVHAPNRTGTHVCAHTQHTHTIEWSRFLLLCHRQRQHPVFLDPVCSTATKTAKLSIESFEKGI